MIQTAKNEVFGHFLEFHSSDRLEVVCLLFVSCLFVVCLLSFCCLFVVCLLFVCGLFVVCFLFVLCLFVVCLLFVCSLFVVCLFTDVEPMALRPCFSSQRQLRSGF